MAREEGMRLVYELAGSQRSCFGRTWSGVLTYPSFVVKYMLGNGHIGCVMGSSCWDDYSVSHRS